LTNNPIPQAMNAIAETVKQTIAAWLIRRADGG
jgi:hypothetical protein